MRTIGNLLWILLGGFLSSLAFLIVGILWCVTLIGIPVGLQCFKFAGLAFLPFGKEIVYGNRFGSALVNVLWLFLGGLELAIGFAALGLGFCVTIVGIPFGIQYFKFAKLSLLPFGAKIKLKTE